MRFKQIHLLIFSTFFLFITINLQAQENWSLERCINYAIDNNLVIKQQGLSVQLAEADLLQSKATILPDINGNASHAYNFGQTIDRFTNTFATERVQSNNFYLSSNIAVFNGFVLLNTIRQNKLNLLSSRYNLEKMQDDVSLQIATAYLNILYNIEVLEVAETTVAVTRQQVDRTEKMVKAGTLAKGNLLTIEAQKATEELQVVNAKNQLDLSYLTLTQMLDLPTTEGFEIEKPDVAIPDEITLLNHPESIYSYAVSNLPEIKSAEISVESSMRGLAIARGYSSPSLILSGSYGTGYSEAAQQLKDFALTGDTNTIGVTLDGNNTLVGVPATKYNYERIPFKDQINDNLNKSIGLYMSVPIFNGLQTRTSINRAKIAVKNAEYNLQISKNELYKTIQQAHADAVAALNEYHAAGKSVEALEESFNYTEQKFNVGLVNTVEYNDAKSKLTASRSDLLRTKYNFIFRKTILDFYMGKPIKL
ncbi:TolC family protein [Bacteroidota bacterium]